MALTPESGVRIVRKETGLAAVAIVAEGGRENA
jgi:hypothetical protein